MKISALEFSIKEIEVKNLNKMFGFCDEDFGLTAKQPTVKFITTKMADFNYSHQPIRWGFKGGESGKKNP